MKLGLKREDCPCPAKSQAKVEVAAELFPKVIWSPWQVGEALKEGWGRAWTKTEMVVSSVQPLLEDTVKVTLWLPELG